MAIIRCPECGHEISDKAPFCPSCGVAIAGKVTVCPECGKVYFSEVSECPQCHHKTETVKPAEQKTETVKPAEQKTETVKPAEQKTDNPQQNNPVAEEDESEHSSHNSSRNNKIIIIVAAVFTLIMAGICYYFYHSAQVDSERQAYEYAMSSKDPQVLQRYLDNYADAPEEHRDSIQAHLALLNQLDQDWTNAVVSGSKSALQQYLEQHPDSPYKLIAVHKIDSIDWNTAQQSNTVEAVEAYLEQHPDGEHVADAQDFIKTLNSKSLQPEEKQMVVSLLNSFLQSLNNRDEDAITSLVNPLLNSFLGKSNATRGDVVTFMHKIYKDNVASMKWESVGDYSISKKEVGDQEYNYSVAFSAVQSVTTTDNATSDVKYKINATINNEGRISDFNMVKILE